MGLEIFFYGMFGLTVMAILAHPRPRRYETHGSINALHLTAASRHDCNRRVSLPPSLSSVFIRANGGYTQSSTVRLIVVRSSGWGLH